MDLIIGFFAGGAEHRRHWPNYRNSHPIGHFDIQRASGRLVFAVANCCEISEYHHCCRDRSTADYEQFRAGRPIGSSLFGDARGDGWNDALQLEPEFGGATSRLNAIGGDRNDFGNADSDGHVQFHGEGNGFGHASAVGDKDVLAHRRYGSYPGADYDRFGLGGASGSGVCHDACCYGRSGPLRLEPQFGRATGRLDAIGGNGNDLGNANGHGLV